jgi:hypothetical protein
MIARAVAALRDGPESLVEMIRTAAALIAACAAVAAALSLWSA